MRKIWKVKIIESERGWGQKVDSIRYFSEELKATEFVNWYNAESVEARTTDIYWKADIPEIIHMPSEDEIDLSYK